MGSAATQTMSAAVQVPRKGPIRVATDYPLVAELLTDPAFEVLDRSDEASAGVLIALRPVRDFYALPRSVTLAVPDTEAIRKSPLRFIRRSMDACNGQPCLALTLFLDPAVASW